MGLRHVNYFTGPGISQHPVEKEEGYVYRQ